MSDRPRAADADSVAAAQRADQRFFRWALPVAGLIALSVGTFWWAITWRQVAEPIVRLRDGAHEWVIESNGRIRFDQALPLPLQQAIQETLRTGQVTIGRVDDGFVDGVARDQLATAAGDSHLAKGVVHSRAGHLNEAVSEFRLLAAQNPGSKLAEQLLAQVEKPGAKRSRKPRL